MAKKAKKAVKAKAKPAKKSAPKLKAAKKSSAVAVPCRCPPICCRTPARNFSAPMYDSIIDSTPPPLL